MEKKFIYLKDQYRRIKSKEKNKASGSNGGKPQKPWKYYNSLIFLDDVILIKNNQVILEWSIMCNIFIDTFVFYLFFLKYILTKRTVSSIGEQEGIDCVMDLPTKNVVTLGTENNKSSMNGNFFIIILL